jgi:hypothetical protein
MALVNNIFSGIKAIAPQDLVHADQYNVAQARTMFQHEKFVMLNTAAKEAYTNVSTTNGPALNNMASMVSSLHSPDPL